VGLLEAPPPLTFFVFVVVASLALWSTPFAIPC
jgi:hypothetical protein